MSEKNVLHPFREVTEERREIVYRKTIIKCIELSFYIRKIK